VLGRGPLGTSLLLIFPLLVIYEIGLLSSPFAMNGVDFVTERLAEIADYERGKFLALNFALAGIFAYFVYTRRGGRSPVRAFTVVAAESAVYGVAAAIVGPYLLQHSIGSFGAGDAVIASAGAGVHEELLFRLGFMMGGAWLLRACGIRHGAAVLFALLGSSVIFSAAHHVIGHQPWRGDIFLYRTVSGLVLGLIAYYRSLAHAVYTHFTYDVIVFTMV
jgi:hypothetical protein